MSERGGWRAAADIGGTFTDLVLVDREGRCAAVAKLLTSADDPARSVTEGLDRLLADAGVDGQSLEVVVHGTTLVANALIERRGADRVGHPVSLRTTTISEASAGGQHRRRAGQDGVDDLAVVEAPELDLRDPEVGVPELALNDANSTARTWRR